MELIYKGKTKDVYRDSADDNGVVLFFKDDMTGKDGVFDPGENQVGLTVEGSGRAGLKLSSYFFEKINALGYPTHFKSADLDSRYMYVHPVETFGKGVEVICRFKATGSFIRRYGAYIEDGEQLDDFVEFTLKDDKRQDPPINEAGLVALDILQPGEHDVIVENTLKICKLIKEELAQRGFDLYDIKLEFGRDIKTGEVMLIDEISGGNMRVYKAGQKVDPLELVDLFFK
ncbi:phosphoribosylaminoimidazolesuccinocarboxamide synthase [Aliicoccus persicus]|uniref:phosphoribosylaminoimidazolesuccinocarboxamide synthase n=1 Tax=Aliicoccus persicus TaxID=930138 RepID=A0A662Z4Z0_9STAP|nr:phosphoribosylaminoimidazolesuccinocarboxamide synthase [Aliicoccus persicus]SEW15317.1 phosphoribosylaminoimidazole-succinocarboxamide synthase [Aliicoccus persicus]